MDPVSTEVSPGGGGGGGGGGGVGWGGGEVRVWWGVEGGAEAERNFHHL